MSFISAIFILIGIFHIVQAESFMAVLFIGMGLTYEMIKELTS